QAWVDAYGAITELMLSGADYSPEIVQLETTPAATTTTTASPVELVESSFEKIKPQANEFVASFYENLFTASPEAKPLFNTTNMAEQKKKLLASLVLVVENIRKPEVLESALKGLGAKHVKYGALPEHYPLVGNALLTTFEQYLGSDWTPEVKQAWVDAYGSITELMLSGADYSPEIVKLETAPKTPTAAPVKPTTQPVYSASTPVYQEEEINWGLFGGIFAGAGLLTIILLLLL
ncbi:MAG: globin family protein, partial [Oscillatoria sp. PMC 1068.18]|nr:globin family protein [Oscillatoria sp. PMC 1068.18]